MKAPLTPASKSVLLKRPAVKIPTAPSHLSAEARKLWAEILRENAIDDRAGLLILATALEAFDRMRMGQEAVARDGVSYRDRYGQIKANPATAVERDSRTSMLAALKQLNLDLDTTLTRSK